MVPVSPTSHPESLLRHHRDAGQQVVAATMSQANLLLTGGKEVFKESTEVREKTVAGNDKNGRKKGRGKRLNEDQDDVNPKRKKKLDSNEEEVKRKFLHYMKLKRSPFPYYKCKCNEPFLVYEEALAHVNQPTCRMPSNKKVKETECKICHEILPSVAANTNHFQEEHGEPATCEFCPNIEFKTRTNLNRHMRTVHGGKNMECSTCGKQFNRTDALNRHMLTVHRENKLENPVEQNPFYDEEESLPSEVNKEQEERNPFYGEQDYVEDDEAPIPSAVKAEPMDHGEAPIPSAVEDEPMDHGEAAIPSAVKDEPMDHDEIISGNGD